MGESGDQSAEVRSHPRDEFSTTHWSVVLAAGSANAPKALEALEQLCRGYWYPLYAFVRRQGHSPEDAQDLTQEFFARFLERRYFAHATPARGRFRSFLLTSLKHFLINEWERQHTARRGGAHQTVAWETEQAETRYRAERLDGLAPDALFEKRWAATLLERVLAELRSESATNGRAPQFEALKPLVLDRDDERSYRQIGQELGLSEGAVKTAVHRLRRRYRELLRNEVSRTVATPAELEEELQHLIAALRG